jgi:hypothetical protein
MTDRGRLGDAVGMLEKHKSWFFLPAIGSSKNNNRQRRSVGVLLAEEATMQAAYRVENLVITALLGLMVWGIVDSTKPTKLVLEAIQRSDNVLISSNDLGGVDKVQ